MARAAVAAALAVLLAACGHVQHLRWPWSDRPAPPPEPARELVVTEVEGASPAAFPQYWNRNTLVVDLQRLTGAGSAVLMPREGAQWPMRLAFRVVPGRFGVLEVQTDQRVILPIAAEGTQPVDLTLDPAAYSPQTERMVLRWGPRAP